LRDLRFAVVSRGEHCAFNDDGIKHIVSAFPALEHLNLMGANITNDGILYLCQSSVSSTLKSLSVEGADALTDGGMDALKSLRCIQSLSISIDRDYRTTARGMFQLVAEIPTIIAVHLPPFLHNQPQEWWDDEDAKHLMRQQLKRIRSLTLAAPEVCSQLIIDATAYLPSLLKLHLYTNELPPELVERFIEIRKREQLPAVHISVEP